MALRPKQQRFVEEYCVDWNATQAAIRAGYRAKRADQIGYENLRKPEIQAAIHARRTDLQTQCEVTQETVVNELAQIAFSDLRTYVQWGPDGVRLVPSQALATPPARVVCMVSQTVSKEGGTLRIKLHDKIAALDKLAKHLGLYQGQGQEEEWGTGLIGLKEMIEAREHLKSKLDKLAQQARANGEGEG